MHHFINLNYLLKYTITYLRVKNIYCEDLKNIKSDAENLNNDYKIELEKFNKANEVLAKRSEEFIKNVNAYKAKINPTKSDYEELASQK